jgi:hypothetical protein
VAAFEHPAFQDLIHIASRATRTINIMSRKQTRTEIISLFKVQMSKLKERLNVRRASFKSMLYKFGTLNLLS